MQYSAIQCSTVQYSTVRYSRVQCSNTGRYLTRISSGGGGEFYLKICKIRENILRNPLDPPNFKAFKDNDGHYFHFLYYKYMCKIKEDILVINTTIGKEIGCNAPTRTRE